MKEQVFQKIEDFSRKYYINQLIKGLLVFIGFGLMYFLFTSFLEYYLWLPKVIRAALFWSNIVACSLLAFIYIITPLFKLFHLKKGLTSEEVSAIIGTHFPEVSDKLLNFIQLSKSNQDSELLNAAIEQKAKNLSFVPFVDAIPFKKNLKYVPLAILPILIVFILFITNNQLIIKDGFARVSNYNNFYEPPAPYSFQILNSNLTVEQGKDFELRVKTVGQVVPENISITYNNENYYMDVDEDGVFSFNFKKINSDVDFIMNTERINSPKYTLKVSETPSIMDFQMVLSFPSYLNKKSEIIKGNGNALVPEGTQVSWVIKSQNTNKIDWQNGENLNPFTKENDVFKINKTIRNNTEYQIITSNNAWKGYEKLSYKIEIIKDQYPKINVFDAPKELNLDNTYLIGDISDDYGLTSLQIVYYPIDEPKNVKRGNIAIKNKLSDRFVFSFPSNLNVEKGKSYSFYFEVFDNDKLNNYKSTKSSVFSQKILTEYENQKEIIKQKGENINQLSNTIKEQNRNLNELENLQKLQKQKNELSFKDKQKIQDFIDKQKRNEELMKQYSDKLKDNLKQEQSNDKDKKELERRLDQLDKESEKQQKLLDELERLSEMMQEDKLFDKMDEMKQKSKSQMKKLEQLVELTKKYYVEKKLEQIGNQLDKLSEKQEKLADDQNNNSKKQEDIQKGFKDIQKEMRDLEKENKSLKRPMDLPTDKKTEDDVNDNMQKAKDDLDNNQQQQASPKQKNAAQKMKYMSMKMKSASGQNEQKQMQEDVAMLRQILDNLLAFSFNQEELINQFKKSKKSDPKYADGLRKQQKLKQVFKHIDDSLYVVSMRNAQISEMVLDEVGKIHYNIDKSLERLADMEVNKGLVNQQYTLNSANKLADFLSNVMNNMQMQMSGSGSGQGMPSPGSGGGGKDKQLPDIIEKQGELGEKMKEAMQKGKEKGEGEEKGEDGKGKKNGEGEDGEGAGSGNDGEQNAKELMEIYKEQRKLRQQLEDALKKQGLTPDGKKILDQMKDGEKQLLNKGFRNENLQKILNIKHELLKLEKALQQQGEDEKRKNETNLRNYDGSQKPLPQALQNYLKSIENLNRQNLPLQPVYKKKVDSYFN